ncbi:MAG: hypothetical protein K0R10_2195 [Alphaproteobacteria bacterium]|jgi:hypothetical protein|nr:hypothetical protein [Alphaproteobacteria bacterium]
MDKKPDPKPLPLPDASRDFFNKVAPRADRTPLKELQERYADKRAEDRLATHGTLPIPNHHSTEFIVEMRIREWMMRMEREAADERKARAAIEAAKTKPPVPPAPK